MHAKVGKKAATAPTATPVKRGRSTLTPAEKKAAAAAAAAAVADAANNNKPTNKQRDTKAEAKNVQSESADDMSEASYEDAHSICILPEMRAKDTKRAKPVSNFLEGFGHVIEGSSRANKRAKRAPTLEIVGASIPRRDKFVVNWEQVPNQIHFYENRINDDTACLNNLRQFLAYEFD